MSSPNAFASFSIFKGNITTQDFMHLVRESDGSVVGWIDQNGTPQGTLATGGGAPGTSNVPWIDIQSYGGVPKPAAAFLFSTTTVNTTAGSPDITVGSAGLFQNGSGVCIFQGGNVCAASTPSAPTVTAPSAQGSQTLTYKIAAIDALGGISAASNSATVTDAPTVFGSKAIAISSATASGGVVTVNFASALNNTVSAGMTIHIVGLTGSGASWNGVWTIASAPTTSEVTFDVSGATGTATVTNATGRVSNVAIITAISRAAGGVVTLTLAENVTWIKQTGNNPTIVIIENCSPLDLNGHWVVLSVSGTTVTCQSCFTTAESGSVTAGSSTATVYEFTTIACPALSGNTVGYYIYGDSPAPGGSLVLLGRTMYQESHFVDYGPLHMNGYVAPAYVPTTAPSSAQNQMFTSTIVSGGGTTSLVLNNNVIAHVTGGVINYDDGPALTAALAAVEHGQVILSPPQTPGSITNAVYIFNSPITVSAYKSILFASAAIINETWTIDSYSQITGLESATFKQAPQFGLQAAPYITGIASPTLCFVGTGSSMEGVYFHDQYSNGQIQVMGYGVQYFRCTNCLFDVGSFGTSVPLMFNGNVDSIHLTNLTVDGYSVFGSSVVPGQSSWGPIIPNIWFRASDNPTQDGYPNVFVVMDGVNTIAGRGILMDAQYFTTQAWQNYAFGDNIWFQACTTPSVMVYGNAGTAFADIDITGVINDSEECAIFANWGQASSVCLRNCYTSNATAPWVCGNTIFCLEAWGTGMIAGAVTPPGCNGKYSLTTTNAGSDVVATLGSSANSTVIITPTNSTAAAMTGVYVSNKGTNTLTITHPSTAGATFDIQVTN